MKNQLNQAEIIVAVVAAVVAKRKSTNMKDMNVLQMKVSGRKNIITTIIAEEKIIVDVEGITLASN